MRSVARRRVREELYRLELEGLDAGEGLVDVNKARFVADVCGALGPTASLFNGELGDALSFICRECTFDSGLMDS